MLKKFFTQLLSSFMGAWLALVLFGAVAVIVVISMFASISTKQPTESLTSNTILRITLDGVITETETSISLDYPTLISGSLPKTQALNNLVRGLKAAAENGNIKALYLSCKGAEASPATFHALRQAVIDFRKSGKKVFAYSDSYTQGDYYVASVADSLYLNKMGGIAIHGIAGTIPYYKDLLDKIGVTFQVFKVGTYKSAVEPMLYNEMSYPARAQLDTLYNTMWSYMRNEIERSRGLEEGILDTLVNKVIMLRNSDVVLKEELVDRLVYRRNMKDILARAAGVEPDKLNMVSTAALASDIAEMSSHGSTEIAVLYAAGEIEEGSSTGIDCEKIVPIVTELADNEQVKALVLRVNSPGGSVFGSEEIAEALSYFQSKGKPMVVSMGDYAASGGYWISCKANKIYADPLTITGSIGIFGLIPEISKLAANIGISPQTVSTNPNGIFPNLFAPMTPAQSAAMQTSIEQLYDKFIDRVATGRKLPEDKVREIAEGRVWDAQTAVKLGLADELGNLDDAVKWAAKLAKLDGVYKVRDYPSPESGFWEMVTNMTGEKNVLAARLSGRVNPEMLESVLRILTRKNTLALMPVIQFHN